MLLGGLGFLWAAIDNWKNSGNDLRLLPVLLCIGLEVLIAGLIKALWDENVTE